MEVGRCCKYLLDLFYRFTRNETRFHRIVSVLNEQVVFVPVHFEEESWLDKLQAKTLHGKPFGHRCARSISLSTKSDADEDEEDEAGKDDSSGDDEATDKGAG
jgi:hypothetical protein